MDNKNILNRIQNLKTLNLHMSKGCFHTALLMIDIALFACICHKNLSFPIFVNHGIKACKFVSFFEISGVRACLFIVLRMY